VGFEGVYRYQSLLHLVHPTIFPHLTHHPPHQWGMVQGETVKGGEKKAEVETGERMDLEKVKGSETEERKQNVVLACANLRYQYRPRKGFSRYVYQRHFFRYCLFIEKCECACDCMPTSLVCCMHI
jgi:hypothetical protein